MMSRELVEPGTGSRRVLGVAVPLPPLGGVGPIALLWVSALERCIPDTQYAGRSFPPLPDLSATSPSKKRRRR